MGHTAIVLVISLLCGANLDGVAAAESRSLFDYPASALSISELEGQEAELSNVQTSSAVTQSDQLENLRRSIPGEPDIDYPIYRTPPETEFSCQSRATGFAFLCPNGTLFNQQVFVCDWYRHVDCLASENFYGKNAELHMNITNVSDMMAVVTEMMNFPLKTNPVRPTILPPTVRTTNTFPQPTVTTTFTPTARLQFDAQPPPTINPNRFSAFPTTVNRYENKVIDTNTPHGPLAVTNAPNLAFGQQQTFTKEGGFVQNAKTNTDHLNTDTMQKVNNQPIFVSNLGELSTDVGTKFDINKSKIVKPDTNSPITPAPISSKQQANDQLKQSLTESFQNRQNANAAATLQRISDSDLLQSLQQVLRQNPDAISGESDLIEFIQRILERNPDLTADQLNAILSTESDSIMGILTNSVNRNQYNPAEVEKDGKNQLLDSIQNVLNKYKNGSPIPTLKTAPPLIGSAILSVRRPPVIASSIPIFKSTPTMINGLIPIVKNTPTIGNPIPIIKNTPIIESPIPIVKSTVLIASTIPVPVVKTTPAVGRQRVPVLSGVIEPQIIELTANDNRPVQTLSGQSVRIPSTSTVTQVVSQKFNQPLPNQNIQPIPNVPFNNIRPPTPSISVISTQNAPTIGVEPLLPPPPPPPSPPSSSTQNAVNILSGEIFEGGEADLVQILQQILLRNPNQLAPIFSGEADIVTFIEQIKRQNPDFTIEQLNAIISGEANSILQILNGSAQRNSVNGYPTIYEADLLEAIQLVIQKYRTNSQVMPPLRSPIFAGENDLMTTLKRIQGRISTPILSGSADLLEFIRRIEQRNPNLTPDQLNAIVSGEADLILRIFNERQQQNGGTQTIFSGSADLLEAIQQVIQRSSNRASNGTPSGGLLQTLKQIKQQSPVPLFSGESDLLQFSERLQQRNPTLTPSQLDAIISREISSILSYLTNKRDKDQFNNFAVYSGEDDLLVAVQYYVEQYALPDNGTVVKPPPFNDLQKVVEKIQQQTTIPIFSGEADLVQFIEQIKQRNPDFTTDELTAIISGEMDSILQIINGKLQNSQNGGVAIISGEADLLEAIQLVIQKYRSKSIPSPSIAQNVPLKTAAADFAKSEPLQLIAVQSGESDLLQTIQRIQQQSTIPIFSGEADLVQFIEQIKVLHPDLSSSQLSAIITGEANSILQIFNQKSQQNQKNGIPIVSGSADLLEAIEFVFQKYRNQSHVYPLPFRSATTYAQSVPVQSQVNVIQSSQPNQGANGSRASVQGQEAYYQQSNGIQGNNIGGSVSDGKAASYSVEQNKQSQFSNQRTQSTQSQVTKNVYREQDDIYTKTAISHQTRSQSTTTNSEKFHYKITQTIPHQQPIPVQNTQSISTSTVANTYIPPYPTRTPYISTPTPSSRQVFTYPLETEAHKQAQAIKNIATDSINYQQAYNQQIEQHHHHHQQQQQQQQTNAPIPKAYVYTEIENRPPANPNIPHPPLQTVYPAAIQNNVESRIIHRPASVPQYSSAPIPSSLPSIVHEPSNAVAAIQSVPSSFGGSYTHRYPSSPTITSAATTYTTSTNSEVYSHQNSDAHEKVIVKVVKAPGWYLNDADERRSYFDAVAHGLLSENGLVYVNNVQKENPPNSVTRSNVTYLPKSFVPSLAPASQSQSAHASKVTQPFNFINYCPCAAAAVTTTATLPYPQTVPSPPPPSPSHHSSQYSQQYQAPTRLLPFKKRSATERDLYDGPSSYNVGIQSVGRLAGDNLKYQYNLSSLRQPSSQRQYSWQSQPSQRSQ